MATTYLKEYLADVRSDPHKLRKYILIIGNKEPFQNTLDYITLIPSLFIKNYNERSGTITVECDHATYCDLLTLDTITDIGFVLQSNP